MISEAMGFHGHGIPLPLSKYTSYAYALLCDKYVQTHTYVSCRRALLERGSAPQKYFHFVTRYFTTCRSTSSTSSSSYKYFLFVTSYLPTPAGSFWFFYTRPATTCPRVLIAAASLGSAARTPPPLALPIVAPVANLFSPV